MIDDHAIFLRFLPQEKGLLLERLQRDNEKSMIVWREGKEKRAEGKEKKRLCFWLQHRWANLN